ncbi:MAG TPA: GntR family transcriptional regulator [Verrucomicrobiales bacterium]|nr:GntR family transcriptional regulator [Verrucomicrobiales bacterium]
MAMSYKHMEISLRLKEELASGRLAVDGRLPSEAQLVNRFGVSRPTVARALRDLQTEGLVERRAGSGTYVKPVASQPVASSTLGLLVPGLGSTEILALVCGELAGLARAHGQALAGSSTTAIERAGPVDDSQVLIRCRQLIQHRVAGVFFAPHELEAGQEGRNRLVVKELHDAGIPVVLLDRDLVPFPQRTDLDLIGIDNFAAGYLLAEHLIKLGRQRIAFVARPYSAATVDARIAGVREGLLRRELEVPVDWVRLGDPNDARFVRKLAAGRKWDAVICANDLTAVELMQALTRDGFQVPGDLGVAGFDDTKSAALLPVPLTTVQQPCREMAITAYHALSERIADPTLPSRTMLLTPRLVVRESCGEYQR